ncbi:hypothetical protein J421_6074 (plasmid) [Gemmatirosa kalamazoonensis]|uniref:Uncharacterized protein n=1 Tax=Gemmatirosa kalamazoonensis TaxID=861299 RepID=W0RRJ1_9BACT|nr:hypothetical protein [Gemmatirosa kalamazoonensis]AHG93609.1 hypothetical protein J421_6074 [Gemmatirosa kalamazoonensis]
MNGGAPPSTLLRALRHEPVLVDDLGAAERLAAIAGDVQIADLPLDPAELVRWTRAWLVALQAALHDRGAIGVARPWTVSIPRAELPGLKGDPERRRQDAALSLLERAALLACDADRATITLLERAFVPHRAGLEIAWGALGRAVRWEPAPLLVARALAELVVPPDQPAPVTLRELVERTGYAAKQVRSALRRLTDADVLTVRETAGMPSEYCFGTVAIPVPELPATAGPTIVGPPVSSPPPSPSPAPAGDRRVALRMTLNGVTVTLGAGLAPHVELGPDGVPHLSFD